MTNLEENYGLVQQKLRLMSCYTYLPTLAPTIGYQLRNIFVLIHGRHMYNFRYELLS